MVREQTTYGAKDGQPEDEYDFRRFSLGFGNQLEKKLRLDKYLNHIQHDSAAKGICFKEIRKIKDKRHGRGLFNPNASMDNSIAESQDFLGGQGNSVTYAFNNNFIKRNTNIMPFYRDHEKEKRALFVSCRDQLLENAKNKK